jgi:catechol 2,3-dioxygenase-like lactoylglutathione lyase family enzyme
MISATMVVTTVPVTDLERAKKLYGGTLGLEFLWETPAALRYRCGALSELSVFKRPPVSTEHTLAHFEVDDIEARAGPGGKRRRLRRLWRRAADYHRSHRPTRSGTRRLVPRSGRQHPWASARLIPTTTHSAGVPHR